MTTSSEVRAMAMALPEVEESPHFESASFRVCGKILATLGSDTVTLKLPALIQESLCESDPQWVDTPPRWGRYGWTTITLAGFDTDRMADLIGLAWRQVAPKALLKAGAA